MTAFEVIRWGGVVVLAAACVAGMGWRAGRAAGERERARLAQRLETFTRILAPVADAGLRGEEFEISEEDFAVLALLVGEPGEDGDRLAELEEMFHQSPDH